MNKGASDHKREGMISNLLLESGNNFYNRKIKIYLKMWLETSWRPWRKEGNLSCIFLFLHFLPSCPRMQRSEPQTAFGHESRMLSEVAVEIPHPITCDCYFKRQLKSRGRIFSPWHLQLQKSRFRNKMICEGVAYWGLEFLHNPYRK